MKNKSMTALVSAFARAYHFENKETKVFSDSIAKTLIGGESYNQVAKMMVTGIDFFNPNAQLEEEEALRWIVDNYLSPSPIGRSRFTEDLLENAVTLGAEQYLILGAGYDSFAYRQPDYSKKIKVYEIDDPATMVDKLNRLESNKITLPNNVHHISLDLTKSDWSSTLIRESNFNPEKVSFCSLLGLTYYLTKTEFTKLLSEISSLLSKGSALAFDYPDEETFTATAGLRTKKQQMLATKSGEPFKSSYEYITMEKLLSDHGFLIYHHLDPKEITQQIFSDYNLANPDNPINAFDNVNYCLAVKKLST